MQSVKSKIFYIYLMFGVSTSFSLSPCVAVMLPPPTAVHRLAFMDVDKNISETRILRSAPIFTKKGDKIVFHEKQTGQLHEFSEKQMDQLYDLAVKCKKNSISQKELIAELKRGDFQDWVE
nr:hypothetical protein [Naviculales sp.]